MSLTAPSTPEHVPAPTRPGVGRSFTVPTKLAETRTISTALPEAAHGIETLFTHGTTKVVSFSTASSSSRPSSSSSRAHAETEQDVIGTLPWAVPTERTIAAGPLRIYRVPSSGVSFINSGNLLHPVLPKSQCWCVDGESKFVLQIRLGSYYRIELLSDRDDTAKVEEFKAVLGRVLRYEKTACPFKRGFHVELPEKLERPAPRRTWKSTERAKRWRLHRVWEPEDGEKRDTSSSDVATDPPSEDDDSISVETSGTIGMGADFPQNVDEAETSPIKVKMPPRPIVLSSIRTVTAPPQLTALSSTPSTAVYVADKQVNTHTNNSSSSSSVASFFSINDSLAPLPPSPPQSAPFAQDQPWEPHLRTEGAVEPRHKRDVSELTITPHSHIAPSAISPGILSEDGRTLSFPSTPTLVSDADDMNNLARSDEVTPPDTLRLRQLPTNSSQRRALSPMPHPANLFTPTSKTQSKKIPSALIQKTYALLLGPPAHLVTLMLRIAARIANGASVLHSYNLSKGDSKIPGTWESSGDEDEWAEDEHGIPLSDIKTTSSQASGTSSSRDVD